MDFNELVQKRESCRRFSEKDVDRAKLLRMVEAARLAPSACNGQPWSFILVHGGPLLEELRQGVMTGKMNRFAVNVPAFIVVVEEPTALTARAGGFLKGHDFPQIDIGIATAHLVLAAEAEGLSTCILGWFSQRALKALLGVPGNRKIRLVVAVGHGVGNKPRRKVRKSLEDVLQVRE